MFFKKSKRGISPLVATVLLIAFAVSLGAVLINLGANIFGDPCKTRTMQILTIDGAPRICHIVDAKKLSLTVVNTGSSRIDGFKLSIIGDDATNEDITEKLEPLEKKVISYPLTTIKKIDLVSIVPFYDKQGQYMYCPANAKDYTTIPNC